MKRLTSILLALAACSLMAMAQTSAAAGTQDQDQQTNSAPVPHHGNGQRGGHGMDAMMQELNLTADQQAKVKQIMAQQRERVKAVRSDPSLTQEQKQAKLAQLRQDTHSQIAQVLTPEQQKKLEQMHEQGHERMAQGREERFERMSKFLDLTAEQKEKIQPLLDNEHKQMEQLHADQSITPQEKTAKAREIRQSTMQQIKQILTPEQQTKLQQMHHGHEEGAMHPEGQGGDNDEQ